MYRHVTRFANLTPLRFLAAFLVVIFHVEETRKMFGLSNLTDYSLFGNGPLAVTFFFVLSGFLITYLLLKEHGQNRQINVRRFYVRRMLRTWPLYFLMVFIGLVLIPAGAKLGRVPYEAPFESRDVAAYFLLFVPFVVNLAYGNHFLTPLWSIGVEETYYLAWAPVAKFFRRHLLAIMVGVVVVKTLLAMWAHYHFHSTLTQDVLRMLQFEAMAIGGLGAYYLFYRTEPVHTHWLFSRPAQVMLILPLVVRLCIHNSALSLSALYATIFGHPVFTPLLLMVIFAWFIINVAANERSIVQLDSRVLNYLGELSYGIYVFHALAISLVFVPFLDEYRAAPGWSGTIVLHLLVAAITVVFAALSRRFFELRFLQYKTRFQALPARAPSTLQAAPRIADSPISQAA